MSGCPASGTVVFADKLQTSVRHDWTEPTAFDPEQGNLDVHLVFGKKPGAEFNRGFHSISYEATDNGGQKAICSFTFEVKVISCQPIAWPSHGAVNCSAGEFIYGSTCQVNCLTGYEMVPMTSSGSQTISCTASGQVDSTPNTCQVIKCPWNDTKLQTEHGYINCTNENTFNSLCVTKCKSGYGHVTGNSTVCNEDKTWSNKISTCKDVQPPSLKNCPANIVTYSNKNSQSDPVVWATPFAEDNSGTSFVNQTKGPPSGTLFPVGITEVRYVAFDLDGNASPECTFFVTVEENPCDPLPAPLNGAIVCDTWLYGRHCQMQCSSKYDIPFGTAGTNGGSFTGAFTCTDRQGTFMPSNFVPNCTVRKNPTRTGVLGEFFYYNYTGDCNDDSVLTEIKGNFIKHMQKKEVSGFGGVCPSQTECNVDNTVVTCGQTRVKKSTHDMERERHGLRKRSTHEIRVEFTLTTSWHNFNSSNGDTFYFLEDIQTKMFNVIKQLGSYGNLTVRGLSPDINSFQLGYSDPFCPNGTAIRWSTLTCVPCSVGNYLDTADPWRPGCRDCPLGTYKDTEEAISCTQCPAGTSTLSYASTSFDDCIDKCKPGQYSGTGLVPCVPCPRSTYQSQSMATSCLACPPGKTSSSGSVSITDCKGIMLSGYHILSGVSTDSEIAQYASTCHVTLQSLTNLTTDVVKRAAIAVPSLCDASDQCSPNPCNGHPCLDGVNSFVCKCTNGYTGEKCQIKPDFCSGTPCKNFGTCQSNEFNFTCICPSGYRGERCETKIVNGGWSEWTEYTACSASCNGGTKSRTRECNSPSPDPDGIPCNPQFSSETISCNTDQCPVCPLFPKSFGTLSNCTTKQDGNIVCSLSCRHGLIFSETNLPLSEYKCGPDTAYKWNGIPPACGRGYGPQKIIVTSKVSYHQILPCDESATVSQALKNNLQSGLQCVLNNICDVQVDILGCSSIGRKRRSSTGEIVLTLSVTFLNTDIDLASYQSYQNTSQPLAELITAMEEIEASSRQLNSTFSLFTFLANGITFSSSSVSLSNLVQCENSLGTSGSLCVECPSGTYLSSRICQVCPIGTYQDVSGKTSCKNCPSGYTTNYVASQDSSACSVPSTDTSSMNKERNGSEDGYEGNNTLLIVCVSATLCMIVLVASFVIFFIYRHIKRSQMKNEQMGTWASRSIVGCKQSPPPPYTAWAEKKF
ncbi:sushi, von Willebrand factor type A, EGF and pentraxin domain-containing protein 1-like [Saccostrea echinata]|uniref:sushi, von Willebrand factor type A, EGF and pentraxin domain-containing protein 1-like n=1 Tax=Saccostrea echinata TaxID=191078 RepID=UPI002A7FBD60|nr:sushi, von Willebrand factor type A, EGF and pentraxin domain-containing protein 1-like [Saccostrea echinata]